MAIGLLFCSEDLPKVLGQLHEQQKRLLRPHEVVQVCRRAIELSETLGMLKAIPETIVEMKISERSEKEQRAYHSLLTQLLLMWWREHRKRVPQAQKKKNPSREYQKTLFD